MIYAISIIILIIVIVVFVILKKRKNRFLHLYMGIYQSLEILYFKEHPHSDIDEKVLFVVSAYFAENKERNKQNPYLKLTELQYLAEEIDNKYNLTTTNPDAIVHFIIYCLIAHQCKKHNVDIDTSSQFFKDSYTARDKPAIGNIVVKHLQAEKPPAIGYYVLTKQLVEKYPNWYNYKFEKQ